MKLLKNQGSHTVQRCTTLCILEILGCQAKWYFKCILRLGERSLGLSRWRRGKEPACQRRRHVRHRFDPWVRRISWRRDGNPPQCSCLENPLDRGAWRATVHGVAKSGTRLKQLSTPVPTSNLWQALTCVVGATASCF